MVDSPLLEAFKDKFNTHPSTRQVCAKYSLTCHGNSLADVSKSLLALGLCTKQILPRSHPATTQDVFNILSGCLVFCLSLLFVQEHTQALQTSY